MKALYVNNFNDLQQAIKRRGIIYITSDIDIKYTIYITQDTKLIGLNKYTFNCCNIFGSGILIRGDNNVVKNLIIENANDCGLRIQYGGYNNIINCDFRYNNNSGLSITKYAHHNNIVNCFSYRNCDYKNFGKSADGFSCKLEAGPDNKFINCYSFENSDDGFDNYDNYNSVYYINCIANHNGDSNLFNVSQIPNFKENFKGNGNGFKLGSKNVKDAYRYMKNCVAINNKMKGFDQNNSSLIIDMINCYASNNAIDYKLDKCKISKS